MFSISNVFRACVIVCIAGTAKSQYTLQENYDSSASFFNGFDFITGPDPTHGFVDYVDAQTANQASLAGYANGAVYLGVDHTTYNPAGGRGSVRVESKKTYTRGLFIADIAHMPSSTCGVWPAFWTYGPNWPSSGEIDIIEGVSQQTTNIATLHTGPGCSMTNAGAAAGASLSNPNCNAGNGNDGCSQSTSSANSYGDGFNHNGGGIYAMEWTHHGINIFFFPRASIPGDIISGNPNPSNWGAPQAKFADTGCNVDNHFQNHKIVFDTTFCGDWAGNAWSGSSCASKANTCQDFVANNPAAFVNAYWLIKSLKVYTNEGATKRDEENVLVPMPFMA